VSYYNLKNANVSKIPDHSCVTYYMHSLHASNNTIGVVTVYTSLSMSYLRCSCRNVHAFVKYSCISVKY